MTRIPPDPAAEVAPVPRRGARATHPPGLRGRPGTVSPDAVPGPCLSSQPSGRQAARKPDPGAGAEDPAAGNRVPSAPGRGRTRTPAGAGQRRAEGAAPAGQALRGEEWRKAAKAAAAKGRRKTTRTAASKQPVPPPPADGARLTATAHCGGCDWTAGPGTPATVDRAAEKHGSVGHPTATVAELVAADGAA